MSVNYERLQLLRKRSKKDLFILERFFLAIELRLRSKDDSFEHFKSIERNQGPNLNDTSKFEYDYRLNKYFRNGLEGLKRRLGKEVTGDVSDFDFAERILSEEMRESKEKTLKLGK